MQAWLATIPPGLYQPKEAFDQLRFPQALTDTANISLVWRRFLTVRRPLDGVDPQGSAAVTRQVPRMPVLTSSDGRSPCPITGTWQPWVPAGHPLEQAINQPWRQEWIQAGQAFPKLTIGEYFPLKPGDLRWYLLEAETPTS